MYTVKQAAYMTGLTVHAVRYYDDNNLIPFVERNVANQRLFTDEAVEWLYMCKVLRGAGLSIKEIKEYSSLYMEGDNTIPRRAEIIRRRKDKTEKEIKALESRMKVLDTKLQHYDNIVSGKTPVWTKDFVKQMLNGQKEKVK